MKLIEVPRFIIFLKDVFFILTFRQINDCDKP